MFDGVCGNEAIFAIIGVFATPIVLIWAIYSIIKSANVRKVKTAMIEQGMRPEEAPADKKGTVLQWACSLIGAGIGLAVSTLFADQTAQVAIVVALLGVGMLGGYFLRRAVNKEAE
ncbi:MAG: DUF6249 domain-containing protein [Tidjanibacter sp.]|nr:DUF6249 domain-containing protein [Tidjanibacter sp.]